MSEPLRLMPTAFELAVRRTPEEELEDALREAAAKQNVPQKIEGPHAEARKPQPVKEDSSIVLSVKGELGPGFEVASAALSCKVRLKGYGGELTLDRGGPSVAGFRLPRP